MNNLALVESKSLREEHIDQVNVLEKVKAIEYMTDDMIVSVEQSANYYEVGKKAITTLIDRHNEELKSDGLKVLRGKELKLFKSKLQDEVSLKYAAHYRIIPRRALLRIGMLLTESEVAKKIRDYLLNSEQQTNSQNLTTISDATKALREVKKVLDEVGATAETKLKATKEIFSHAGVDIPITYRDIRDAVLNTKSYTNKNTKLYLNKKLANKIMNDQNWGHSEFADFVGTSRAHVWRLMSWNSSVGKTLRKKLIQAFPQYQDMLFVEVEADRVN